jgi:hypothetical protein
LKSELFRIILAFFLILFLGLYVYTQNHILLVVMLVFYLYATIFAVVGWAGVVASVLSADEEIIKHVKKEESEKNIDLVFILIGFMWTHNFYVADFLFFSGILLTIFLTSLLITLFTFLFRKRT